MISRRMFLGGLAGATAGLLVRLAYPQEIKAYSTSQLIEIFAHPPDSARPWVYWFWANGNVTQKGITADLEAIQRVGIGGVLIMEVDPAVPPGRWPLTAQSGASCFISPARRRTGLDWK